MDTKKVAYAKLVERKYEEDKHINKDKYKLSRKVDKIVVTTTKTMTFKSLYAVLEVKDRERKYYRLTKARV